MTTSTTVQEKERLLQALHHGENILVIGPTGSGKARLLAFLHERADVLETRAFLTGEIRDPRKAALAFEIAGSVPTAAIMQAGTPEEAWERLAALQGLSGSGTAASQEDARRLFPVVAMAQGIPEGGDGSLPGFTVTAL